MKYTGKEVKAMRKGLKLTQTEFWTPLGLTQSGGSRYESHQEIPKPVCKLIYIHYEAKIDVRSPLEFNRSLKNAKKVK